MPTKSGFPRCPKGTRRSKKEPFPCLPNMKAKPAAVAAPAPAPAQEIIIPKQIINKEVFGKIRAIRASKPRASIKRRKKITLATRRRLNGLLDNPADRRRKVLSKVCPNTAGCIALGKYEDMINDFFADFQDLRMVSDVAKLSEGNNGEVTLLTYTKRDITAYTVMKRGSKHNTEFDNLMYEYVVGKFFVNTLLRRFPNFVETYGLYVGNSDDPTAVTRVPDAALTWKIGCAEYRNTHIMLQYYSDVRTMLSLLIPHETRPRALENMRNTLFQVYFPLMCLRGLFTHHDLHEENVLMYKPLAGNKYVEFHYHFTSGRTVTFPSEYVAKIIDYGRSYFKHSEPSPKHAHNSSKETLEIMCDEKACGKNCGTEKGFYVTKLVTSKGEVLRNDFYNDYIYTNDSYSDFKLLNNLFSLLKYGKKLLGENSEIHVQHPSKLATLLNMPVGKYNPKNDDFFLFYSIRDYFMPEMLNKIDEMNARPEFTQLYAGWTKGAVMHVYQAADKDYTFEVL